MTMTLKQTIQLRPAQKIYAKIFNDRVLKQKEVSPSQIELPCNFGKTELIVNYNIIQTIKEYRDEKIIHFCVTMMTSLTTFSERLSEDGYGKGIFHINDNKSLKNFLSNYKIYLRDYNQIVVFTTLNMMSMVNSGLKFYELMDEAKKLNFKWTMNRDEGDYAAFDDPEHQAFESGASVELGGSKYATEFLKFFEKYKDTCLYFLALSGSTLYAHKGEAQLVREMINPISQQMNSNLNKDIHGIVTDEITNYVSKDTIWKRLETEEEFYQMKHLNVEYNSVFLKPDTFDKSNWKEAVRASLNFLLSKQKKVDSLKSWLISNISNYYPDVDKEKFANSFDNHQKMTLIQSGKDGQYNKKSFIMPTELIGEFNSLEDEFNINPVFVHSEEKIVGTVQNITKNEIKKGKIDVLGCVNMLTRGFDISYISSIVLLATSPKMNKSSESAPYTKRQMQTKGRAAREDNGFKNCNGLSGVKSLLLKLGIDVGIDNYFNQRIREYVMENLKVKTFLLDEKGVDTASYVAERMRRYYVMEDEMKITFDNILGISEEVCPLCKGTGKKPLNYKRKNIFNQLYSKIKRVFKPREIDNDFSGIDKELNT